MWAPLSIPQIRVTIPHCRIVNPKMILQATPLLPLSLPPPLLLLLHRPTNTIHNPYPKPHRGFSVSSSRGPKMEPITAGSDGDAMFEVGADGEEEEEEGEFIPLQEMGRWLRNKPAGFGEGKSYDTQVEETLLEEIERTRAAQIANLDKLRSGLDKREEKLKENLVLRSGTRVRVSNLPRKKNVHRDLQLAFKGFHGILTIKPAVIGNRKTRDPICKGLAFIDLESEEIANRFVQKYSRQSVLFGKVQKLITCSVLSTEEEIDYQTEKEIDDQTEGEIVLNLNDTDLLSSQVDVTIEHTNLSHQNDSKKLSQISVDGSSSRDPLPSLQKQRNQVAPKKKKAKSKSAKSPTHSLPSSMTKLNVKERTILTGVFSKYGGKAAPELSNKS